MSYRELDPEKGIEDIRTTPGKMKLVKATVEPRNGPPRNGLFSFLTGFFCEHPWPEELRPVAKWLHGVPFQEGGEAKND